MNRLLLLQCVLLFPCSFAFGQTNTALAPGPAPALAVLALDLPADPKEGPPTMTLSENPELSGKLTLLPHADEPMEATHPLVGTNDTPAVARFSSNSRLSYIHDSLLLPRPVWNWRELPARLEDPSKPAPAPPPAGQETEVVPFQSKREMDPNRMALVERLRGAGLLEPPRPEFDSEVDRAVAHFFRRIGIP